MDKFKETLAQMSKELTELKKINAQLKAENEMLRKQLGMKQTPKKDSKISLDEAFDCFEVKGDTRNTKLRAYNTLLRACSSRFSNYDGKDIKQFEGKSAYELYAIRNMGVTSLAIIIIVMEHLGVSIEIPDVDCNISVPYYRELCGYKKHTKVAMNELRKVISEYRQKIIFKD